MLIIYQEIRERLPSFSRSLKMGNPIVKIYKALSDEKKQLIHHYLSPLKKIARCCTELRFRVYEDTGGKNFYYLTSDIPDTGFIECFYPGATVIRVGTIYAWSLRKFAYGHDKVIIDMHSRLARFFTDDIIAPRWVRQTLDLATPVDELFNKRSRRKEIEKVKKFRPVFSTDPADLDFFYDQMYIPYIRKWQDDAVIIKKVVVQKDLAKIGELCFLKLDDKVVAGQFCNHIGDTYILMTFGLTDEVYVREGATAALFYYGILRAQEKGARYVDLGLSRPFISDGVLNYKRKWGGRIQRDHVFNHVMYLKNITKDGLIILDDDTLKILVSEENAACRKLASGAGMEIRTVGDMAAKQLSGIWALPFVTALCYMTAIGPDSLFTLM
jgi:hypothetical protein